MLLQLLLLEIRIAAFAICQIFAQQLCAVQAAAVVCHLLTLRLTLAASQLSLLLALLLLQRCGNSSGLITCH